MAPGMFKSVAHTHATRVHAHIPISMYPTSHLSIHSENKLWHILLWQFWELILWQILGKIVK